MTKFEALKQLPVDRFADLFYEMGKRADNASEFKGMLMEEFPDDLIPALLACSTGADLKTDEEKQARKMAMKFEKLKTVQIDVEKGLCLVNGEDFSSNGSYFKLEFKDGEWSLELTEDRFFVA